MDSQIVLLALPLLLLAAPAARTAGPDEPPAPPREFRGVWVATVDNIDWPSKRGLPVERQKAELLAILDRAARMNLNAVVLQVRPACDALYASKYEPWSEYLTGVMGRVPEPFYDPLAFAVEEAHRRGLELHAWFNPYRAHHPSATGPISADHVSRAHPEIVRRYGRLLWLDPGEKAVQDYSLRVIMDVVRRYDIDGVHLDDYFYPYKEQDAAGNPLDFPDEPAWRRYRESGGTLDRADWRRRNVDAFIERLYHEIKEARPRVKFGISPFGIWRPGHPEQIRGFDAYSELYADARKWLKEGWVDYLTPQLYWSIEQRAQSYPALLRWWTEQNPKGRHIWPGNYTSRVADGSRTAWSAGEIVRQIEATRGQPGASGNVHFSMKALMEDRGGLCERLERGPYGQPALVPECPWLGDERPRKPKLTVEEENGVRLAWTPKRGERAWLWVVQARAGGVWSTRIVPGGERGCVLPRAGFAAPVDRVAVSGVSRTGVQGPPAVAKVR